MQALEDKTSCQCIASTYGVQLTDFKFLDEEGYDEYLEIANNMDYNDYNVNEDLGFWWYILCIIALLSLIHI